MGPDNDTEAYLNTFESCNGSKVAQGTLDADSDAVSLRDVAGNCGHKPKEATQYEAVKRSILRTLNLTEAAYWKRF